MNPAAAFRDQLLAKLPTYGGTGRAILAIPVSDARDDAAFALVDLAVRAWLPDALEASRDDLFQSVTGSLRALEPIRDAQTAGAGAEFAADAGRLAQRGSLADLATAAADAARAAVAGNWGEAAESAADALYEATIDAGTEGIVAEVERAMAATTP